MYEVGYEKRVTAEDRDYNRLYARVVGSIDPNLVLEHYDARNVFEQRGELIHSCLIDSVHPHHSHGDESPSAALNIEHKLYSCYSYGGGDIVWLIMELEDIGRYAALQFLAKFLTDDYEDAAHSMLELVKTLFAKGKSTPPKMPVYSEVILRPWRKIHPYLADRGISDEVVVAFKIGFDDEEQKITIPHFWNGKLVGYQKRRLELPYAQPDASVPKYKNSTDFPKESTLYNFDTVRSRSDVIVVESVLSVLKAQTFGIDNTVATFGGKVTPQQAEHLKEFDSVTLFFDNDPSGWSGTTKLYSLLHNFCKVKVIDAPVGLDLADMDSAEQVQQVLSSARMGSLSIHRFTERMEQHHGVSKVRPAGRRAG